MLKVTEEMVEKQINWYLQKRMKCTFENQKNTITRVITHRRAWQNNKYSDGEKVSKLEEKAKGKHPNKHREKEKVATSVISIRAFWAQ